MFISIARVFKFAFQNFWRNIWLSVITVTILVLTLLTVNILIVLQVLGKTAVKSVEERIDVTVSFVPDTQSDTVAEVRSYLSSLPQVTGIDFISAEQALAAFKDRHQQNSPILQSLDELSGNPFGPTLVVRARTAADYPFILEALENPTYRTFIQNKNFTDHQAIIDRIVSITDRLRRFAMMLTFVFAVIAVLIIMNTIRVAIYTYREEIGIMKLVGASNWFVRAPFLLESILYSLFAVVITIAIVFPAVSVLEPVVQNFFEGTSVGLVMFFKQNFFSVFGVELGALVVLTVFSSSFAVGRYLRA